jgi:hypothetical protein
MHNGTDLRRRPLSERKATLRKALRAMKKGIQYVAHVEGHGAEMFDAVCKLGRHCIKKTHRALSLGPVEKLDQGQKSKGAGCHPGAGWKFLVELRRRSNGYLRETEVSNVIQVSFFGLAVLVSASSISMAQSMPNYGPNPPSNTDSFGQVPSGGKPPGVSRYGHRAYAYVPNQHRHHYRYRHHRHWY